MSGRPSRSAGAVQGSANIGAEFKGQLSCVADDIESLLGRLLAFDPLSDELSRPPRLLEAMRYATLGGGKRLRPFLVVAGGSLFAVPREQSLMVGAALECVHCYSLIHDDLPAMDNDDLRRGRPTLHKAFDEATAILAGDGLLTIAFDILSRKDAHPDPGVRIALVAALARGAGLGGMVGGQMLDLAAEGRYSASPPPLVATDVALLQAMKTGALLRFACIAGPTLAQAEPAAYAALDRFGALLGEAFQIADDLLDLEGDPELVGKSTGKDGAANKATFVAALGPDEAKRRLARLVAEAEAALSLFGSDADVLRAAAHFVANRRA
jgi:farnesyl diphosphate synthase